MAKKKRKTIGKMTNGRGEWTRNPQTQVVDNGKKSKNRKRIKEEIKKGNYDV